MAQYDLLLTQNVASSGVEFSEKYVNIAKAGLLSGDASGVPTVLAGGTNGYHLVRDDNEATGLKWAAINAGHTQGTDAGTTETVFELDSDGYKIELTAESAAKLGVKVDGGGSYADLQVKDITAASIALTTGTVSTAPANANDLVNKTYADGLIAAADAMVFKGTIGSGGTHEIAAFNSLATYNAGWAYRVITAGTIKDKVCEVGDLVIAMVDRAGSGNVDGDWTVVQTNLDGAVIGPASVATDGNVAVFNGTGGKLLKDGGALGTAAFTAATAYLPTWVSAPATKTSTGTAGTVAKDDNWFYICTATNVWKRSPIATNW